MTYEEFKTLIRDKEASVGTLMTPGPYMAGARAPFTEEEIRDMYEHQQGELVTGVAHHGTIIAGPNVLDVTKY